MRQFSFKSKELEIELKNLDFIKKYPKIFAYAHKTDFYQLIYIQSGKAVFGIDFENIELTAGEIIILLPKQVCEFDTKSQYTGINILFTSSFYLISHEDSLFLHSAEILSMINNDRKIKIDKSIADSIISLLDKELKTPQKFQTIVCQSLLRSLLYQCERIINKKISISSSITKEFITLVELNFTKHKNISFYSSTLCINEKKLSNEITKNCGITPKQYIINRTLLEAKRLLRYSDLSIKEIAWSIGFDDLANFSNWFKKLTNLSPLQFKENK